MRRGARAEEDLSDEDVDAALEAERTGPARPTRTPGRCATAAY